MPIFLTIFFQELASLLPTWAILLIKITATIFRYRAQWQIKYFGTIVFCLYGISTNARQFSFCNVILPLSSWYREYMRLSISYPSGAMSRGNEEQFYKRNFYLVERDNYPFGQRHSRNFTRKHHRLNDRKEKRRGSSYFQPVTLSIPSTFKPEN